MEFVNFGGDWRASYPRQFQQCRKACRGQPQMEGVMMKPKLRLTLLACALGAASIATAQTTKDIPPPNDVIRLPGSVMAPNMPVVVSPPRDDIGRGTAVGGASGTSRQAPPLVCSLGSESTLSDEDTLSDGAATGAVDTTKAAAPTGKAGIVESGDKPSKNAGNAAGTETSAASGANSGTGDTSNMAEQNNRPDNSTTVPAGGIPRTNAPANAQGASSGK
jgi:hypothetical protein